MKNTKIIFMLVKFFCTFCKYFLNHKKYSIEWEYLSKKKPEFSDDEYMHYGMTRLELDTKNQDLLVLRGDYFTDRSRHQYGQVEIKKA